jgi:hypothetical protein
VEISQKAQLFLFTMDSKSVNTSYSPAFSST